MEAVRVWEELITIPTYQVGNAEKNPIFLEKRVYQGSSGKIYPYPAIETISDEKRDKQYKAVYLENEYIRVMILPELGGRIQRAYDKTNDYDFVYYNHVIKPALVGLTGPWISGGIEFNWPQHHRPTTFMPVDYLMRENEDGSRTVLTHDVDQMYGTKGITELTLYPGRAYIEVKGQLYNRTPMPQTFLWWANPALAVNDYTQSVFPPDVHAVMDHGKRDVSRFPIATGVYYKHDYGEGVDISRYKNIPVPTSYMAAKSDYDFVGGYDYNLEAGVLHVADHHISPGKKQWTWGCGDFGKAWDRNLTDEDGPYIELMTGVFTDNQPDFTWLKPFEEKTFKQYFLPYKKVGAVKNATIHCAVNLEKKGKEIHICVYATVYHKQADVRLYHKGVILWEKSVLLSPEQTFETVIGAEDTEEENLKLQVWDDNMLLVSYETKPSKIGEVPEAAQEAKMPSEIMTNDELYLTGLHIEQYRHATYLPDPYYEEGLKRDNGDLRINNAYGLLWMRRGRFDKAEKYFRKAIERSVSKNPNPYNSEPYYNLGLALMYQERPGEAYDMFYKAVWTSEQQEMSYYYLAALSARKNEFEQALEFIECGLIKNTHNIKARGLKAYLLRKLQRQKEAALFINESLKIDRFDFVSMSEQAILKGNIREERDFILGQMNGIMRNFAENYLQAARDYGEFGGYEEALTMLSQCTDKTPMIYYYEAFYRGRLGSVPDESLRQAEQADPVCCFPNKPEDIAVLAYAAAEYPEGGMASYYLGNLFYDRLQFEWAVKLWEESAKRRDRYPTVLRNLALAYYNKCQRPEKALEMMEKAFYLDTSDARIFLELDQLYKKLGVGFTKRLANYEKYRNTFLKRDDLYIEYITLHNYLGRYEEACELVKNRRFHPWEGGEGKITAQYTFTLKELAKKAARAGDYTGARAYLQSVLVYPENLGEGKLEGTKDNHIYYYLGCIAQALGEPEEAKRCFTAAAAGNSEPAGMMYYNDQPADMILFQGLAAAKLGQKKEANARFYKLIDYGEKHLFDECRIEYFAVSLPDFQIYEEDLNVRNMAHCRYLIGLGNMGLGKRKEAEEAFEKTLELDETHLNARIYREAVREEKQGIWEY